MRDTMVRAWLEAQSAILLDARAHLICPKRDNPLKYMHTQSRHRLRSDENVSLLGRKPTTTAIAEPRPPRIRGLGNANG